VFSGHATHFVHIAQRENIPNSPAPKQRYTWPWFVLAALVLAVVLAILWLNREIERTRRFRDLNAPPPAQGSPSKEQAR
jgi:flagellar biosynthesis/type III secretory pathway M-ring protein FliF/YscJ